MSGFRALPELDPPETCILVTFALNRSHRGLSYKEWFTPAAILAGNGKLLPNCVSTRIR